MTTLEEQIKDAAEKTVIKIIASGEWIGPEYNNRFKIPHSFLAEVWDMVDHEKVKVFLKERIERELADRIINHLAAEMATDIKQLLSNQERREALRAVARENLDRITGAKS